MMNKYEIATGRREDIEAIAQFQVDMAAESEGTTLDYEKVFKGVSAVMDDSAKGTYIIAKKDNIAIASLMLTKEWSDWNNGWYWWIQSVYVAPEYRQSGVYKAMYAYVKELAKTQNVPQVRLYVDKTNIRAQKVYSNLGMHESHYLMYEETIE